VPDTRVPAALLGTDWERIPTDGRVVALTFDGGSSDSAVTSILSTLAREHVSATFFVTGDFARRYPGQVAAITSAGHRVGNHSDSHEHYPALTDAEIAGDLADAEAAIVAAGARAAPWFRFPYGRRTSADIRAVNAAGYVPVRWTVDTLGWKGTSGGQTTATVVQRTLGAAQPGEIVLMHVGANPDDGTTLDADALPEVIAGLRAAGYGFVTVDQLRG
jgi:peptidoglycan/xylan/chitin deacetylase (PgdA/CDA1 family)